MPDAKTKPPLRRVFALLQAAWGPQHWWPARSRFEVMAGAVLTQNTAWRNVEKAITALRRNRCLGAAAVYAMPADRLARLIRPAGYYNIKARRLKNLTAWIMERHRGRLDTAFRLETSRLRRELLDINGIGPETADSILLYAAERPVFVVDAYTCRVLRRHGWLGGRTGYDDVAALFEDAWASEPAPRRTRIFNEYHALLVRLAKEHCRSRPDCRQCPLNRLLPAGGPRLD